MIHTKSAMRETVETLNREYAMYPDALTQKPSVSLDNQVYFQNNLPSVTAPTQNSVAPVDMSELAKSVIKETQNKLERLIFHSILSVGAVFFLAGISSFKYGILSTTVMFVSVLLMMLLGILREFIKKNQKTKIQFHSFENPDGSGTIEVAGCILDVFYQEENWPLCLTTVFPSKNGLQTVRAENHDALVDCLTRLINKGIVEGSLLHPLTDIPLEERARQITGSIRIERSVIYLWHNEKSLPIGIYEGRKTRRATFNVNYRDPKNKKLCFVQAGFFEDIRKNIAAVIAQYEHEQERG